MDAVSHAPLQSITHREEEFPQSNLEVSIFPHFPRRVMINLFFLQVECEISLLTMKENTSIHVVGGSTG